MQPPAPIYIPTPKHILEARKVSNEVNAEESPVNKKPKLEYVPEAKTPFNNLYPVPTYIPSVVTNAASCTDDNQKFSDLNNVNGNGINGNDVVADTDDIAGLLSELSAEHTEDTQSIEQHNEIQPVAKNEGKCAANDEENKASENKTNEASDTSSTSKHRRHSSVSTSSSRSHGSRSDKKGDHDKSSSSSSRRHSSKDSSTNHKSSSRSSHKSSKSSSSHHSRSKSKHRDKSKEKSGEKSRSSSSKSSSRHQSSKGHPKSSSSSSHKHKEEKSTSSKDCTKDMPINYETDSEEDDVEAQCRKIFEGFDPSTIEQTEIPIDNHTTNNQYDSDDGAAEDASKKKRVAHENAERQIKSLPTFKRTANHVQNAMQVNLFLTCCMISKLSVHIN